MSRRLLLSVPVEPHGSINAQMCGWLLRVCVDENELPGWGVRWDIVHDKPVAATRNRQVRRFLYESDNDVVLFLDADMVPSTENVRMLLDSIEREDVDVVSGIADQMTKGGPMPVLYRFEDAYQGSRLDAEFLSRNPYDGPFDLGEGGVTRGTGAACLMATRKACEAIAGDGRVWFKDVLCEDPADERFGGRVIGQDAWFFIQCHELGLRAWIDTRAYFGHVKPGDLSNTARLIHRARKASKQGATT